MGQHSPHRTISTLTGCINVIPGISNLKHHMQTYRISPPSTPIKYEDFQWVNKSSEERLPAANDINGFTLRVAIVKSSMSIRLPATPDMVTKYGMYRQLLSCGFIAKFVYYTLTYWIYINWIKVDRRKVKIYLQSEATEYSVHHVNTGHGIVRVNTLTGCGAFTRYHSETNYIHCLS